MMNSFFTTERLLLDAKMPKFHFVLLLLVLFVCGKFQRLRHAASCIILIPVAVSARPSDSECGPNTYQGGIRPLIPLDQIPAELLRKLREFYEFLKQIYN